VRIVVLGGGFGGVTTARHLERRLRGQRDIEITLVSRENFFVLTPLLFESCSGRLELRHCAQPIRAALRRTRFIEARHLARNLEAAIGGREPTRFVFRPLGTMASLGHMRAVALVFGMRLTGFPAWWLRRTYYLFQMPRWDRRLRIVLDWTVALFFRPDITKVELRVEREQVRRLRSTAAVAGLRDDRDE
jgi:NADH dehydrogenase FAD-containing subunit